MTTDDVVTGPNNETPTSETMPLPQFDTLAAQLHGRLLLPTDDDYDSARRLWNSMFNRHPIAIAQCEGVADVQATLAFGRAEGLPITVRGGGHDVTGRSMMDDALAIDLSPMNGVTIDPVRMRATVQAGAKWAIVDREAQVHGLATTGGTVSNTGVAGLTLGGGIGWLMRTAGVTVDNVISIDAVTVDGRAIRISKENEPDLFWGMLGAGANFAIATSFEFRLHPVGPLVHGGMIAYRGTDAKQVLSAWRDFMLAAPRELSSMASVMRAPVAPIFAAELHGEYIVALLVAYTGPPDRAPEVLAPFRGWGPVADLLGPLPYVQLQRMLEEMRPWRERFYEKGGYIAELSDAFIDAVITAAEKGPQASSGMQGIPVMTLMRMGGAIDDVDNDATAFSRKNGAFFWDASATWQSPRDDATFIQWCRELNEMLEPLSSSEGYINFTVDEAPNWLEKVYGVEKYARLVALKQKWDPENVFVHNRNIAPSVMFESASQG